MTLRRCPACKNMIARETWQCPICGSHYAMALVRRILPWTVVFVLLAFWVGRRLLEH